MVHSQLYSFPLKKTQEEREREKMMVDSQHVISASQQSRVDQVTQDLVQWMRDLVGGCSTHYTSSSHRLSKKYFAPIT